MEPAGYPISYRILAVPSVDNWRTLLLGLLTRLRRISLNLGRDGG